MKERSKIWRWIGIVTLVIGLGLICMIGSEFYDGRLYGSRSEGITRADTPLGYYLGVVGQSFCALLLSYIGIASLMGNKKK
jgi:drug/metabolite transporter (DMT)-like permease